MIAHNILYTYIAPFLALSGLLPSVQIVLLAFGVSAVGGIWLAGLLIDRLLRSLVLLSLSSFLAVSVFLGFTRAEPWAVWPAVILWGLAFGGAGALLQTACAEAAGQGGSAGDEIAPSLVTTSWNLAIAGGGALGGLLLQHAGAGSFPFAMDLILAAALLITWRSREHGFPPSNL